eukprot:CAMPEP_0115704000 /NCGR_PEP_ID=MMETSP0272-20121206/69418_1 /TAXON_ID=71861 /ORGANISM="Scrippsiella trochoidea, Strain CCMP3099" /LENGTH=44 /DNA_ID= /DNA_START= /DNA_END= /DNA_ORIENTATION=
MPVLCAKSACFREASWQKTRCDGTAPRALRAQGNDGVPYATQFS